MLVVSPRHLHSRGEESIYYHGPHELSRVAAKCYKFIL